MATIGMIGPVVRRDASSTSTISADAEDDVPLFRHRGAVGEIVAAQQRVAEMPMASAPAITSNHSMRLRKPAASGNSRKLSTSTKARWV